MPAAHPTFQAALAHLARGALDEAEKACRELLKQAPADGQALHLLAMILVRCGRPADALEPLKQAVRAMPGDAAAWNNLGELLRLSEQYDEADAAFDTAIRLAPDFPEPHYNRALVMKARGAPAAARAELAKAIELRPAYAKAHFVLANLLAETGELPAAIQAYQQAIASQPRYTEAYQNLSVALERLGQHDRALACLERAVAASPNDAQAHGNLGAAYSRAGLGQKASASLRRAAEIEPEAASRHTALGDALRNQGQLAAARTAYEAALRRNADSADAHQGLGLVAREQAREADAERHFSRALELAPDDDVMRCNWALTLELWGRIDEASQQYRRVRSADRWAELHRGTLCPFFPRDHAEIDAYRDHVARVLDEYEADPPRPAQPAELVAANCHAPFAWPYHGRDDRPLKARWASLVARSFLADQPPAANGPPHVGLVVTKGHESIFMRSMRGILERWPRRDWQMTIVCAATGKSALAEGLARAAVDFLPLPDELAAGARAVREARFDLLYYWEVATDVTNYFLPFYRLARVQCTSWGWQVTTGIPQIDYYISSRRLEPPDAGAHYSERLILLESLPTCYARPAVPEPRPSRQTSNLPADAHIYFCAQNLLKVHPDFDDVIARILERDPQGLVVFTSGRYDQRAALLRARWQARQAFDLDRVRIVPGLAEREYLGLMAAADVALDTLHYGGVNTTYDAIAAGTPLVTLPGAFQRGRYALGVYDCLAIDDCIAGSIDDYVSRAVSLAGDPQRRRDVSQRLLAASPVLFDQTAPALELADCFEDLLARVP